MKNFLRNLFLGIVCAMFFAGTAQIVLAQNEKQNGVVAQNEMSSGAPAQEEKPSESIAAEVVSKENEKITQEDNQNGNTANKDFEDYTIEELRQYIAKLPQTETDAEVIAFEKFALSEDVSYLRILELSLYYQGWGKDVFYQIKYGNPTFYSTPTNKQMREGKGEIRNAQKAFLFAVLAKNINIKIEDGTYGPFHALTNLAYLYYEGIGTPQNYARVEKICNDYVHNPKFGNLEGPTNDCFFAYLFWYGKAGVSQNKDKAMRILAGAPSVWRCAYTGFMCPKDKQFAIDILEKYERGGGMYYAEIELMETYRGKYSDSDKNFYKEMQMFHRAKAFLYKRAESDRKHYGGRFDRYSYNISKYKHFEEIEKTPNPEYSKENVKKYLLAFISYFKKPQEQSRRFFNDLLSDIISTAGLGEDVEEILPTLKEIEKFSKEDFDEFMQDLHLYNEYCRDRREKY